MKITLEIVRDVLRNSLGRDSFVGSVITKVIEDPNCATACITADGLMRYGPEFTRTFVTDQCDLFCLVMHELMHPLFGHFVYNTGPLENIAADMVINASLSQFFANESGQGGLFTKFYEPRGLQGLLRPKSQMRESRYEPLYEAFYWKGRKREHLLSTGEVIQTLKVLTPTAEAFNVSLLGSHAANDRQELSSDSLSRIADDIKKAIDRRRGSNGAYNESLFDVLVDVLKSNLTLKRAMLKRFATKQKVDHFRHFAQQRRTAVSPMPINPSKRDIVLLSSGITPFHYRNKTVHRTEEKCGIAIYVDVSGSVNEYLPRIVGLLQTLRREVKSIFLFSNKAIEVPLQSLLTGAIKTTYGTDFNCIAESILSSGFEKAVVMTDGYASLNGDLLEQLRQRKVLMLTVLFGGKTNCPEFEHLGDVIQLDEIVQ